MSPTPTTDKKSSGKTNSRSRPTKRRSRAEIEKIECDLYHIAKEIQPATVRQIFYQAVTKGIIDKTEKEYKNTIVRLLGRMRRAKSLPFDWIADNTRWMRKPKSYSSIDAFLRHSQRFYRRDIWDQQDCQVEIWLEKEALAGVLLDVTAEWDVPLMVTRGYPSLSYLHSAAESIEADERVTFLYYFGDHDPSGVDISRFVQTQIRELVPEANFVFQRVAVNDWQIEDWNLPTRPTKKTDSRAKSFKGESVEVDAIPPAQLRELCRECIEKHIDQEQLESVRRVEELEKETLRSFSNRD